MKILHATIMPATLTVAALTVSAWAMAAPLYASANPNLDNPSGELVDNANDVAEVVDTPTGGIPIPEPAGLFVLGLAGLIIGRRLASRHRKSRD